MRKTSYAILGLVAFGLIGCVSDGPRDSSGTVMSLSEPKVLPWEQASTNLPLFFKAPDIELVYTARDRGGVAIINYVRNSKTFANTQFVHLAWFSPLVERDMKDRGRFMNFAARFNIDDYAIKDASEISHRYSGFYGMKNGCWAVQVAARLKGITNYENDRSSADTVFRGGGCDDAIEPIDEVLRKWSTNEKDSTKSAIRSHFDRLNATKT